MTEIRTGRLLLRRARIGDLAAVHAILSDRRAMRYWWTLPHETREQSEKWLRSMIDAPAGQSADFIVELDGKVIGKAGCYRLPEVGFIFHPDHWRRGFAREALAAAIDHVWGNFPVGTLTADVDPRNRGSLGLLKSLGFYETGRAKATWTLGEEVCDSVYLALHRPAPA